MPEPPDRRFVVKQQPGGFYVADTLEEFFGITPGYLPLEEAQARADEYNDEGYTPPVWTDRPETLEQVLERQWQGTSTEQTAQHLEGGTTFRLRVKIEQNSKSINQEFTAEVEGGTLIADMESDLHNALDACRAQARRMTDEMYGELRGRDQ